MKKTKLLRRTRLRRASKKRLLELEVYCQKRVEFMAKHPCCQVCGCGRPTDIHHTKGRGKYYLDESTWMAVCRLCHQVIHDNPEWAEEEGYIDRRR